MSPTHDLPSGRQIEEAWRGVEDALRSRRRRPDRRVNRRIDRPIMLATTEELTTLARRG